MAIRATGRAEFIRRLSLKSDLERLVGKEVEWFANAAGNIISTIVSTIASTPFSLAVVAALSRLAFASGESAPARVAAKINSAMRCGYLR
jgi:hypothetical protein